MGRKHAIGGVFEQLQLGVDCVIVCSSHKADPLTVQFDRAVRDLRKCSIFALVPGVDLRGPLYLRSSWSTHDGCFGRAVETVAPPFT